MTPLSNHNLSALQTAQINMTEQQPQLKEGQQESALLKADQNRVTLSNEGKALLATLQDVDSNKENSDKEKASQIESFAHGALGLDHPDSIKEQEDSSYSAGQYLKGALSVGAMLLALV